MAHIPTIQDSLNTRLGYDLRFPIQGNFEPTSGLNLLIQDISQLLLTIPGERVGRPTWGCNLRNRIWGNIHEVVNTGKADIRNALETFEPRIIVTAVTGTINTNNDLITFAIRFVVKDTDTQLNLIFPFRTGQELSAS